MWKYLTQKAIRRRYAKSPKQRDRRFIPYREAKTVAVLADEAGVRQAVPLLQAMSREGKKVVLYCLNLSPSKIELRPSGIDIVEISPAELCHGGTAPPSAIRIVLN